MFSDADRIGSPVLSLFLTVGFPDVATSTQIAKAVVDEGADFLELGVPFSDPLAEGPTIQKTSHHALEHGVTVSTCLDVTHTLRSLGTEAPLVSMGYYNPYLRYGLERFVRDAADAGVDGLIVPDLPHEEDATLRELCDARNVHLIPLLAPTSTDQRIAAVCEHARGFIYCVSVTGVTGAREQLRGGVEELVSRIRRHTALPVMVGFGVKTREHVESIGAFATGALIGSALMDAVDRAPEGRAVDAARDFVASVRPAPGSDTESVQ